MKVHKFYSNEGTTWNYVFHFDTKAIAEAAIYMYGSFLDRTVIRISVQSGCEVGCLFCSSGKNFVRNLLASEMLHMIDYLVKEAESIENDSSTILANDCKHFQIMFMGMGEPMLNWNAVEHVILQANLLYPKAEMLISTVGIKDEEVLNRIIRVSRAIPGMMLQLSVQDVFEEGRDEFIPYKNKLSVREIRNFGTLWNNNTGKTVMLDYSVSAESITNNRLERLLDLFDPHNFQFNFSATFENRDGKIVNGTKEEVELVTKFFRERGYEVTNDGPTEKDDARGAGHSEYVQDWMDKLN